MVSNSHTRFPSVVILLWRSQQQRLHLSLAWFLLPQYGTLSLACWMLIPELICCHYWSFAFFVWVLWLRAVLWHYQRSLSIWIHWESLIAYHFLFLPTTTTTTSASRSPEPPGLSEPVSPLNVNHTVIPGSASPRSLFTGKWRCFRFLTLDSLAIVSEIQWWLTAVNNACTYSSFNAFFPLCCNILMHFAWQRFCRCSFQNLCNVEIVNVQCSNASSSAWKDIVEQLCKLSKRNGQCFYYLHSIPPPCMT